MTAKRSPRIFSPEEYRRLAKNPFVDKRMLQFIKEKTLTQLPVPSGKLPLLPPPPKALSARTADRRSSPLMTEKTAMLIAAALKSMMQK